MSEHKDLKELTVNNLFTFEDEYIIPIYQRNYSWEKPQIEQLIQDILDYSNNNSDKNYFIGNLIVFDRLQDNGSIQYETIDGQQRLTTLSILMNVLEKEYNVKKKFSQILAFQSREISSNTLEHIKYINSKKELRKSNKKLNSHMLNAYEFIYKKLSALNNKELKDFVEYLLDKVIILRISVPQKTDLNHYFEIMNNRGEQLEKAEIIKARLLSFFQVSETESEEKKQQAILEMQTFNRIWEACENMEKYVQYAFLPTERNQVFTTDWNKLNKKSFDEIVSIYEGKTKNENTNEIVLEKLLTEPIIKNKDEDKEEPPERFNSIINFSNFLLQVLRVQTNQEYEKLDDKAVPLDDKRLLDIFETEIKDFVTNEIGNEKEFSKKFIFNLLKAKFNYDHYVIKRELNKKVWTLIQLSTTRENKAKYVQTFEDISENNSIIKLLSMFHVSYPQRLYKHWLNAVLNYLMNLTTENDFNNYFKFLEKLAKGFIKNRYLLEDEIDYHTIIYKNQKVKSKKITFAGLDKGTKVENFIFNFLDYIIWKNNKEKYPNFEFDFRNSVEHHYPQNPINEADKIDEKYLDNFGNLCLLARKKNSKLSNLLPGGKLDHYRNETIDSIKQQIMFEYKGNFHIEQIVEHREKMIQLLEKELAI